ncbi:twin transmembrane helix small protein, partial [Acidisphaera rubrifaciens]|uniref:twin transmembrane helix small protein n=1 Tax=Acidisphaera rubrifaciens TaxID=50715 RepID=UPI001F528595
TGRRGAWCGAWCGAPVGAYVWGMKTFLTVLIALLMLGVLGVLFAGLFGMVRGSGDPRRSNVLMRWRVVLQAGALVLFAILMELLRS